MENINLKKIIYLLLTSCFVFSQTEQSLKQKFLDKFNFQEFTIPIENDTIFFYLHKKKDSNPKNLVVYLQGTTPIPEPFFNIQKTEKGYSYETYIPTDFEILDDNYMYAIISYVGISAFKNEKSSNIKKYHHYNSLDYRVFQADSVINYIKENLINTSNKIIVYGHSEGAPVAAKLGTINKNITHIGFWAGNALPDYFDFILFESKAYWRKEKTLEKANNTISSLINQYKKIAEDSLNAVPTNEDEYSEYTNKRWWSYAEPPINSLLKITIPLYVQVATEDKSASIESAYLIPLEFIRLKKNNLTFKVCLGCDHGFTKHVNGKEESLWSNIFKEFINWTDTKQ